MIRTGEEYRDGREMWIDGERVHDVTAHPAFKPVVDIKARMYDMAHEPASAGIMSYREASERFSILLRRRQKKLTGTRSGVRLVGTGHPFVPGALEHCLAPCHRGRLGAPSPGGKR